jgi:hypothetical protein
MRRQPLVTKILDASLAYILHGLKQNGMLHCGISPTVNLKVDEEKNVLEFFFKNFSLVINPAGGERVLLKDAEEQITDKEGRPLCPYQIDCKLGPDEIRTCKNLKKYFCPYLSFLERLRPEEAHYPPPGYPKPGYPYPKPGYPKPSYPYPKPTYPYPPPRSLSEEESQLNYLVPVFFAYDAERKKLKGIQTLPFRNAERVQEFIEREFEKFLNDNSNETQPFVLATLVANELHYQRDGLSVAPLRVFFEFVPFSLLPLPEMNYLFSYASSVQNGKKKEDGEAQSFGKQKLERKTVIPSGSQKSLMEQLKDLLKGGT